MLKPTRLAGAKCGTSLGPLPVLSKVRLDLLDPSVLELIELTHQPLDLRREFEIGQFAPRSNWI